MPYNPAFVTEQLTTVFHHKIVAIQQDAITNQIKRFGIYEREIIEFSLALLKKIEQPIVLDVGANIGNHTLAFSLAANHVYAFEPTPVTFTFLQRNIKLNELTNVTAVNAGLSDTCSQKNIYIYTHNNIGASSLEIDSAASVSEPIEVITGDSFIAQQAISKVDFIKIDIEGHELYAIKGLAQTIASFRPIIVMEWAHNLQLFTGDNSLDKLFPNYHIASLGFNYEKSAQETSKFSQLVKFTYKKLGLAKVTLLPFPQYQRENILLVPNEKLALINS